MGEDREKANPPWEDCYYVHLREKVGGEKKGGGWIFLKSIAKGIDQHVGRRIRAERTRPGTQANGVASLCGGGGKFHRRIKNRPFI